MKKTITVFWAVGAAVLLAGCSAHVGPSSPGSNPSPTPTGTSSPTFTTTPTFTSGTPTGTITVTPTSSPTSTATVTSTFIATPVFDTSWTSANGLQGIADPVGLIYVAAPFDGNILSYHKADGSSPATFASTSNPRGVAADVSGNIYVSDIVDNKLYKFNPLATPIATFGTGVAGNSVSQLSGPWAVAVDTGGSVYVADSNNGRILKLDSSLNYLGQWDGSSSGKALSYPYGLAAAGTTAVYVADTSNDRIAEFDPNGNYIRQWGSTGPAPGQFNYPEGVALDPLTGHVVVADSDNNRIQIFDGTGNLLTLWGGLGTGSYQFGGTSAADSPDGVTVDATGKIYVADKYSTTNGLIKVYGP